MSAGEGKLDHLLGSDGFATLLRNLMAEKGYEKPATLAKAMEASGRYVGERTIGNYLKGRRVGTNSVSIANLKRLAEFLEVDRDPQLRSKWDELLKRAQESGELPDEIDDEEVVAVPERSSNDHGRPRAAVISPQTAKRRQRPAVMALAVASTAILAIALIFVQSSADSNVLRDVRSTMLRQLGYADASSPLTLESVGLTPDEYAFGTFDSVVQKLSKGQHWPAIGEALARGDRLAQSLHCFRSDPRLGLVSENISKANDACEAALRNGNQRVEEIIFELHRKPPPLTLADAGLTETDWAALGMAEIVAKLDASDSWPTIEAAVERSDRLALVLSCFRFANSAGGAELDVAKAKKLCEEASEAGEGRATLFLASLASGNLGEQKDDAVRETLRQKAVGQGSLFARYVVAMDLFTSESDMAQVRQLLADFETIPNLPCNQTAVDIHSVSGQLYQFGWGGRRDARKALRHLLTLESDECYLPFVPDRAALISSITTLQRDILLSEIDLESLISLGNANAKVTAIGLFRLTCELCREFFIDGLDEFTREFVDTGKVRLVFLPWWGGDAEGNVDFQAHYAPLCGAGPEKAGLLNFLFRVGGPGITVADIDDALLTRIYNGDAARKCLEDNKKKEKIQDITVSVSANIGTSPSRMFINGKEFSVSKFADIKAEIELYYRM